MATKQPILIVGGCARAAAQSAVRSGFAPLAVDFFADEDLRATCPVEKVENYPEDLVQTATRFPHCPWMYTGALENYPAIVQAISSNRLLLGNGEEILRRIRDPETLASILGAHGLRYPEMRSDNDAHASGEWLTKPFKSGGGLGVQRSKPNRSSGKHADRATYQQRFIPGRSIAAMYCASQGTSQLIAVTEQLVGREFGAPGEFMYAGSVGPIELPKRLNQQLERVGQCLADKFQLKGLFGVDAVIRDDELWVIEVNPRYTASTEIIERALQIQLLRWHVESCLGSPVSFGAIPKAAEVHGKLIVYASKHVTIRAEQSAQWKASALTKPFSSVADIPAGGSTIRRGHPVCTLFVQGRTVESVKESLAEGRNQLLSSLV